MLLSDVPESCTAEEAAGLVAELAAKLGLPGEPPSLRTLRLWRTRRLLSESGRRLTRGNLLEALGVMRLRADGLGTAAAAERCRAMGEQRLLMFLTESGTAPPAEPSGVFAQVTLPLLARGVLEQFRLVSLGAIVGRRDDQRTGIGNTPVSLRQASARLGRLYFEEGQEDRAASVHALLALCTRPLREWAPQALCGLPDAAEAVLIDPDYRVPSEECELIAQQADGLDLEDMVEGRLHGELTRTIARLGDDAEEAYTGIRAFIGRHPMATRRELHGLYAQTDIPDAAVDFVQSLYAPAHAAYAVDGVVARCWHCHSLVDADGRCSLAGCRDDHRRTRLTDPVPLGEALTARPEVLKYWADPAREELRLHDALRRARLPVQLYPHLDRCDVAVGEDIGIDVKDFRNPLQLARRLNRGLGGLARYRRSILAVADRRARAGDYLGRLREQLLPGTRERIEVRSVGETIRVLTRERGGGRARAT